MTKVSIIIEHQWFYDLTISEAKAIKRKLVDVGITYFKTVDEK